MATIKPFQELPEFYSPRITDDNKIVFVDFYGKPLTREELLELKEVVCKSCEDMTHDLLSKLTNQWKVWEAVERARGKQKVGCIRHKQKGCIYVLKIDDHVYKIGRTKNFKSRLSNYKTHTNNKIDVICVINSDDINCDEADLHRQYTSKRIDNREYFSLDDADIEHLKSLSLRRGGAK